MGCDYYILKMLHVYYNHTEYLTLELNKERKYYDYSYDEDEEEEKVKEYKVKILIPEMKPISIYKNYSFNTAFLETKYKMFVENNIHTKNIPWSNITKIIKVEERRAS